MRKQDCFRFDIVLIFFMVRCLLRFEDKFSGLMEIIRYAQCGDVIRVLTFLLSEDDIVSSGEHRGISTFHVNYFGHRIINYKVDFCAKAFVHIPDLRRWLLLWEAGNYGIEGKRKIIFWLVLRFEIVVNQAIWTKTISDIEIIHVPPEFMRCSIKRIKTLKSFRGIRSVISRSDINTRAETKLSADSIR